MTESSSTPSRRSDPAALVALVAGVLGVLAVVIGSTLIGLSWWDRVQSSPDPAVVTTTVTVPPGTAATIPESTTMVADDGMLQSIADDSGALGVSVPATWSDVGTGEWTRDGSVIGASLSASPDRQAWVEGWGIPGIFVGASSQLSLPEAIGDFSSVCFLEEVGPVTLSGAIGVIERWSGCGEDASDFVVAVADIDGTVLLVQLVTVVGDPPGLADAIMNTLRYTPTP